MRERVTHGGFGAVALSLALAASSMGCAARGTVKAPTQPIATPASVDEKDFASALHTVLRSRGDRKEDAELRLGVVRLALAHAAPRFGHGNDERALRSVLGAFYLLRDNDGASSLVDETTIGAFDGALKVLAARGDFGKVRVVYELEREAMLAGRIPGSPADIDRHLADLEAFVRETRKGSSIEIAGEVERAAESRVMLDPSKTALDDARAAISSYIDLGIQENLLFKRTGHRPPPDEGVEVTRALENGATTLVALHLRGGDMRGAFAVIELSSAKRMIDPTFFTVLRVASGRDDATAWRTMFSELDQQASDRGGEEGINEEVLEAAFFGTALEAYRRDPNDLGTALDIGRYLSGFGLSEGVPSVLADGLGPTPRAEDAAAALRVLGAALDADAEAGDDRGAARTIAATDELLAIADGAMGTPPIARLGKLASNGDAPPAPRNGVTIPGLHPSAGDVRLQIGEIEMRAGRLTEARAALERAVVGTPSSDALLELARRFVGSSATAEPHLTTPAGLR